MMRRRSAMRFGAVLLLGALALAGCSSTRLDGQWKDERFKEVSLKGRPVLVACTAEDELSRNLCVDAAIARLNEQGARGIRAQGQGDTTIGSWLDESRRAGAQAVFLTRLQPDTQVRGGGYGPNVGIGMGGFGGFGLGVGMGVGVTVPIRSGRADVSRVYQAESILANAQTGESMWTARAASEGGETEAQIRDLLGTMVDAAGRSGFFR